MSASPNVRSPHLLHSDRSQLLIIDVQEKLLPVIQFSEQLLAGIKFLLSTAEIIGIPAFVSEQYPKGLGPTVSQIIDHNITKQVFEKLSFSASQNFLKAMASTADDRDQIVLVGIETHICVLQTALDLLHQGKQVFVVEDCVGSRNANDQRVGLNRIQAAGGIVTCAESVAFEWCEIAGTPEFKQISRLVRERDLERT